MKIKGVKKVLLFIVGSISIYILISWYLLKFVEPPANAILIIAIFTPFFAGFAGVVIKMVGVLIENMEKKRRNRNYLRSNLDKILGVYLNTDYVRHLSYLKEVELQINLSNFPTKIERKIAEYNKKAEELLTLFKGCEFLVKNMVIKNILKYLYKIDKSPDGQTWVFKGVGSDAKLSELLPDVLKDRIIKGGEINKSLFENSNLKFYNKIVQHSSTDDFADFLSGLQHDIDQQRKNGCLKLIAWIHKETKELAEDLRGDKYVQK